MNDVMLGILTGMGEAHQSHNASLLAQEVDRRKNLAEFWKTQASSQDMRPEARDLATQKYMTILQTPAEKRLPKGVEALDDFLTVSPRMGQSVEAPKPQPDQPPPQAQYQPIPSLAAPGAPVPPPFISQDTLNKPSERMPSRYSNDELLEQSRRVGQMQADMDVDKQTRVAEAQERAKLKYAKPVPFNGPAGSTVFIPDGNGGYQQVQVPAKADNLTSTEVEQQIAFLSYAEKRKLDPTRLNGTQRAEALKEFKQNMDTNGEPLYPVVEGDSVVYRPRSQAAGSYAPRTLYDISGNPTTAGQAGMAATPPPTVPDATQSSLAGWTLAMQQIDRDIIPALQKAKGQGGFGPLAGRVKLGEIEQMGGMGATPQQIALAVDLRRLLMSQAFAEGGKQLTPTEKEEFIALNPALTDTLEQAMIKAQKARDFLRDRYLNRLQTMAPRQRGLVPAAPGPGGPPPGVETAAPNSNLPPIGATAVQDGYNWTFDGTQWVQGSRATPVTAGRR